ncbi:hypothetical protein [Paenibacillus sp. GbtcB18]|uniref:hypothetical protein n=1 Tax=Paenibacillus sp. GbtcB18 TaxID=2824763 RepID=UPI001C2F7DB8|nr:hypothetical protein [Paenibacillus sp. GbtcB18]
MGKYISIRGWFECEEHDVSKVKEICREFTKNYSDTELNYNTRKLYQSGWVFPENQVNWTTYIFYGADIREYHLDFIKQQISKIAIIPEITGYFLIDDHEGEKKICWQVFDGHFVETEQINILFNN